MQDLKALLDIIVAEKECFPKYFQIPGISGEK
jgi:hypothetical protein